MAKAVFCTVKTSAQATQVVDRLKTAGFTANDISVLMPDNAGTKEFAVDNQPKLPREPQRVPVRRGTRRWTWLAGRHWRLGDSGTRSAHCRRAYYGCPHGRRRRGDCRRCHRSTHWYGYSGIRSQAIRGQGQRRPRPDFRAFGRCQRNRACEEDLRSRERRGYFDF